MTDEELKQLKRRFGDDVETWPAPYRLLAQNIPDEPIDRMIREAAMEDINDRLMSSSVLDRLTVDRSRNSYWFRSALASPRLIAATALVLAGATMMGGFQFASMEGDSVEVSLFAVAAGAPTRILVGNDFIGPEGSL